MMEVRFDGRCFWFTKTQSLLIKLCLQAVT